MEQLITSDYGAAIDRARSLKTILVNTELGEKINEIERCIEEFNEDAAVELLKAVISACETVREADFGG